MDSGQQGITSKQVGGNISISLGEFGDQLVSELQARYYEQTYRGNVFYASQVSTGLAISIFSAAATPFSQRTAVVPQKKQRPIRMAPLRC